MDTSGGRHARSFEETGFEIFESILDSQDLKRLSRALGASAASERSSAPVGRCPEPSLVGGAHETRQRRFRAGVRHILREPSIAELARDSRLLEIVAALTGSHAIPYRATLFDKSEARNWLVVWHQDTALPIRARSDAAGWGPWSVKEGITYAHAPAEALAPIVALRVHLDDSNVANGPLRVLPGTHRMGVLSDDAVQQLSRSTGDEMCLVGRGGVVAMRPLIVVGSPGTELEFAL